MGPKQISQNKKQKQNILCSLKNRNIKKKKLDCRGIIDTPRKLKEERKKKEKKATRSPSNYLMIRCYLNLMKEKNSEKKKKKKKRKEKKFFKKKKKKKKKKK